MYENAKKGAKNLNPIAMVQALVLWAVAWALAAIASVIAHVSSHTSNICIYTMLSLSLHIY